MTTLWATLLCSALSFTEQRFEVPGRVLWADGVDVDGDKRADLVVFFRRGEEPNTKRAIAWYLQKDGGSFSAQPSEVRTLADDVSFATLDDLDSDGRTEVVLLSAEAVLTFAFTDKGLAEHPTTILKATTATPFAENEDLPEWKFVDDWHQTGHKELALWKVGALQFFRREPNGTYKALEVLPIPPITYVDGPTQPFRGPWSNRRFSILVSHSFPAFTVGHYDGDRRPDLFVVDDDRLRVYPGLADGRFSPEAKVFLDFGVRSKEEKEKKNSFVSTALLDLNADGLTDYVNNKVSGGLSSMTSQTHLHLNRGGFRKQPDQTIKRDGFSGMVQFHDLNGDGRPDLVEPHADVGLIGLARAMVSKKITVDWLVTANDAGKFDGNTAQKLSVEYSLDFSGGPMFKGPFPRFQHDFDGDGVADFLTSPDGEEVQIFLGQKEGIVESDAAFKMKVEVSPYAVTFVDPATRKPHFLTYFRDSPGRDGRVILLFNRSSRDSK